MKKFIILDSNAIIHRAYHALPPLKTEDGRLANAVYGFTAVLLKIIKELKPDYLAATFDVSGITFRNKVYKQYKAKRIKPPQELYDQIPLIKKMVACLNIPIYKKKGVEADDIIGTIVSRVEKQDIKCIIVTGDLDTLQLVSKKVGIYALKSGIKKSVIYDEKAVKERYGLLPEQMVDFRGLKGDPSDNIPGIIGIGGKTAVKLIQEFGSLENLYDALALSDLNPKLKARLLEYKEDAFLSRQLSRLDKDVKINFNLKKCQWGKYNKTKAIRFLESLSFYSFIDRLP